MAKFAMDILIKFQELVKTLEVELGPDTGDLALRIGMHSGSVTAGILHVERPRFQVRLLLGVLIRLVASRVVLRSHTASSVGRAQLFGDAVNKTARMESSGVGGRIHLSQECADELAKWNKSHWVVPRNDMVHAKGLGALNTYWLQVKRCGKDVSADSCESWITDVAGNLSTGLEVGSSTNSPSTLVPANSFSELDPKTERLVDWNTDTLRRLLQHVVAKRAVSPSSSCFFQPTLTAKDEEEVDTKLRRGKMIVEEVSEVIHLPQHDPMCAFAQAHSREMELCAELSEDIVEQIRAFVTDIAELYRPNAFHNFEHAS